MDALICRLPEGSEGETQPHSTTSLELTGAFTTNTNALDQLTGLSFKKDDDNVETIAFCSESTALSFIVVANTTSITRITTEPSEKGTKNAKLLWSSNGGSPAHNPNHPTVPKKAITTVVSTKPNAAPYLKLRLSSADHTRCQNDSW